MFAIIASCGAWNLIDSVRSVPETVCVFAENKLLFLCAKLQPVIATDMLQIIFPFGGVAFQPS